MPEYTDSNGNKFFVSGDPNIEVDFDNFEDEPEKENPEILNNINAKIVINNNQKRPQTEIIEIFGELKKYSLTDNGYTLISVICNTNELFKYLNSFNVYSIVYFTLNNIELYHNTSKIKIDFNKTLKSIDFNKLEYTLNYEINIMVNQ